MTENDQIGYFAPQTWQFWRALIVCFCVFSIVGHWLEIPYCFFMDRFFGIVADDYAVLSDPWYHPYWVYGIGAVAMTLVIEPLKEHFIMASRTLWGALAKSFVAVVLIALAMELVIGLLVNQPDAAGEYPYWDNSQLPLNVMGQAWLVNDFFLGLLAGPDSGYVQHRAIPLVGVPMLHGNLGGDLYWGLMQLRPRVANGVFAAIVVGFALCCVVSYAQVVPSWDA